MRKSGIVAAASLAAASATTFSSSPSSTTVEIQSKTHRSREETVSGQKSDSSEGSSSDKFAPRFDGLRFIETLVTAHR